MSSPHAGTLVVPLANFGSSLYTIREAALLTKTSEETLRRAVRAGSIQAYGTAGRLRIKINDVLPAYVPRRKKSRNVRL